MGCQVTGRTRRGKRRLEGKERTRQMRGVEILDVLSVDLPYVTTCSPQPLFLKGTRSL